MRIAALSLSLLVACTTAGGEPTSRQPSQASSNATSEATTSTPSPTTRSQVVLMPAGRPPVQVQVEVVRTPAARQRGLMFRRMLPVDSGMLFIFDEPSQQAFWMRNTYIPLDMLFIRSDMSLLGVVENAEPQTDTPRKVEGESQYVLEVNAGFARTHGLSAGTMVRFDGVDLPAAPH